MLGIKLTTPVSSQTNAPNSQEHTNDRSQPVCSQIKVHHAPTSPSNRIIGKGACAGPSLPSVGGRAVDCRIAGPERYTPGENALTGQTARRHSALVTMWAVQHRAEVPYPPGAPITGALPPSDILASTLRLTSLMAL